MPDIIDRQNPMPIAYQLAEILKNKILSGEYPPQSLFPTEEQLTNKYNVSRTTVRMALSNLVNEGLIFREQGRGTFVSSKGLKEAAKGTPSALKHVARDVIEVKSTTHIIRSAGMEPSTKVLLFTVEQPDEYIAKSLKIRMEHTVWYFERIRYADDIPVLLERIWIPQFLCPQLTKEDLDDSLYETFTAKYGYRLAGAHQILRAVTLSAEDADLFGEEKGSPAMFVSGVTYLEDGRPIEMENSLFNSEIMEFIVDLGEVSEFARIRTNDDLAL